MKKLANLLMAVAIASGAYTARAELYAAGAFQGWNPEEAWQFNQGADGVYTLDVDFSAGTMFKISTTRGPWTEFDGASYVAATPLQLGVPSALVKGVTDIVSPTDAQATIKVDLEAMTITVTTEQGEAGVSGTLPVMYINTAGNQPITSKEEYLTADYWLDPCGTATEAIGSEAEPLAMQIRGRGNYTWVGFDKKPYRLKLDKKQALCGMKKSKHFALLAHADDNDGFLRNTVGFELSKRVGMPWTPEAAPVEVVLNGDYIGLYFLTETIRVDEDRVNIVEQADGATTDVDGGWLVEIDNYDTDPHVSVLSGDGEPIIFTYKSPEVLSTEQETWLETTLTNIDNLIYSDDKNVCAWADYIDLTTLARFYIVQEVTDNYESFHGSCYLNRQRGEGEKWMFGPVWDFGNAFLMEKNQFIHSDRQWRQVWIGEMVKYPAFMDVVRSEWRRLLGEGKFDLDTFINDFATRISAAATCDYRRWPSYGNRNEMQSAREVKEWLHRSVAWLTGQWGESAVTVTESPVLRIIPGHGALTIVAPADGQATVSDIAGRTRTVMLSAGDNTVALAPGLYIVEGQKAMVR